MNERVEFLRELFPEAVAEGRVDWDKLRAALGEAVEGSAERYSFSWAGKRDAIRLVQMPSRATLNPAQDESVDWDTTRNAFIEGDNLEVLKLLLKAYYGRVKMIYIDPPYNTGNDFVYPDNYADPLDTYLKLSGQKDADGNLLTTNANTSGRYHSVWLSMMYPRLFLAKQMLREDGVIFVSIDDNEVHNLRLIMNEIFGEENFIAQFVWEKMYTTKNDAAQVSICHEYVICYAHNSNESMIQLLPRTDEMDARYTNPDNDPRGQWKAIPLYADGERKNGRFPIASSTGKVTELGPNKHWRYRSEDVQALIADSRIYFGKDGNGQPVLKRFLSEVQSGLKTKTLWSHSEVGSNDSAKRQLRQLFPEATDAFSFPKPSTLVQHMLRLITTQAEELVMDFFAGTCTTAEAVLELNHTDSGKRRFIMVQLPELTGLAKWATIAEIGKERIRRVIEKLKADQQDKLKLAERNEPEDLGFRVYKLAESNYKLWTGVADNDPDKYAAELELFADPLYDGWLPESVIYEVAVKEGYGLGLSIAKVDGVKKNEVYRVSDAGKGQSFIICLDSKLDPQTPRELELKKDDLFVCRDIALTDELAANLALQCRLKTV